MQINNRSIQDMHLFGNPSHIPIVIIERVTNAPRRANSVNSYLRHLDVIDSQGLPIGPGSASVNKQSDFSLHQNARALKIVVFVHGFQACFVLFSFSKIYTCHVVLILMSEVSLPQ